MEFLHIFEQSLTSIVTIAKFILEMFSVLCVILGFIKTLQLAFVLSRRRNPLYSFNKIRLGFGMWLVIALEFQLGADILATTVAPSFEGLVKLALIAIIRTFLNYFLVKELETQLNLEKEEVNNQE